MNYPRIITNYVLHVVINFIRPFQGRGVVEDVYVGFTPYANILHSYRVLRQNAMWQWWTKCSRCDARHVILNINYHELSTNYVLCVVINFIRPFQGRGVGEDVYVGFTPYANILHSYRVLRQNAMWQWRTKRSRCDASPCYFKH